MRKLTIAALAALSLTFAACGETAKKDDPKTAKKGEEGEKGEKGEEAEKDPADAPEKEGEGDAAGGLDDPAAAFIAAIDSYNAGNFDEALAAFSDDVESVFIGMPESQKGKDFIKTQWEEGRKSFPDTKVAAGNIFVGDGFIAAHMGSNGTHKGEFRGNAPTDKPVGSELLYVLEHDGKTFNKVTIYANPMANMSQIGAAPEGTPPYPVPELASAPNIIKGDENAANIELVKGWHNSFVDGTAVDKIPEFLAENCIHHAVGEGQTEQGLDKAKEGITGMLAAISDAKMGDTTYASAGDFVLARGTWSGKHTGDMGPIKATNKEFNMNFAELALVRDGKIQETWSYSNPMEMMGQLGLLPEPKKEEAVAAK